MRMAWAWAGAVALVGGATVGGVAIANATIFSASAFAGAYLEALSADRIDEVLALEGVRDGVRDDSLLVSDVGERFAFEVLGDETIGDVHHVRVAFGPDAERLHERAVLSIERTGSRFLLFPSWGFASAPVTVVSIELSGDSRFMVGERAVATESAESEIEVTLFRPGLYRLSHESAFLEARAVEVAAGRATESTVFTIRPNERFDAAVERAVDDFLGGCATQVVMYPVGCPFGESVVDRVVSDPAWAVAHVPPLSIEPGDERGLWRVGRFSATVDLTVDVQDLYDGSISTEERTVPFDVAFDVAFEGDTVVLIPR